MIWVMALGVAQQQHQFGPLTLGHRLRGQSLFLSLFFPLYGSSRLQKFWKNENSGN